MNKEIKSTERIIITDSDLLILLYIVFSFIVGFVLGVM